MSKTPELNIYNLIPLFKHDPTDYWWWYRLMSRLKDEIEDEKKAVEEGKPIIPTWGFKQIVVWDIEKYGYY